MLRIRLNYGHALFYKDLKKKQDGTSEELHYMSFLFPASPLDTLTYKAPASVLFSFGWFEYVTRIKKCTRRVFGNCSNRCWPHASSLYKPYRTTRTSLKYTHMHAVWAHTYSHTHTPDFIHLSTPLANQLNSGAVQGAMFLFPKSSQSRCGHCVKVHGTGITPG